MIVQDHNNSTDYLKKPNTTANFKFGTGFFGYFSFFFVFSGFPFWQILTGLTDSCLVVLVGCNRHY